jgi:hypothetical protein
MEPEALTTIAVMFVLLCLFACRPTRHIEEEQEEEIEDSDIDEELTDEILAQLRAYAGIAREVSVKRANGDVYEVKFRSDEPAKVVHNVASVTPEPSSKMVWSEDGRMLHRMPERETMSWGGEQ